MSVQVTPLRQRMIDDMAIRNMSPLTQKAYVRAVKNFSFHFRRSPDGLTFEDVRAYQLHLVSRGLEATPINQIMCALRFLYGTTRGKPNIAEDIPLARRSDPLPAILSRDEVASFLNAVPSLKYRTAFATIYAAGLRVSEAVALTIKDIESERMVIHIRQGKGRKDRYVMLSDQLLDLLLDKHQATATGRRYPYRLQLVSQGGDGQSLGKYAAEFIGC
jgi:integrase/recombinase XerD